MGDRANFGLKQSDGNTIFLYSHWGGEGMMDTLANALAVARPRWHDEGYATRIIISQIIGSDWREETGYGLYINEIPDNEHSIPVVDFVSQTVSLYEASWSIPFVQENPKFTMPFEAFISKFAKYLTVA
jgi:hypothetical protein